MRSYRGQNCSQRGCRGLRLGATSAPLRPRPVTAGVLLSGQCAIATRHSRRGTHLGYRFHHGTAARQSLYFFLETFYGSAARRSGWKIHSLGRADEIGVGAGIGPIQPGPSIGTTRLPIWRLSRRLNDAGFTPGILLVSLGLDIAAGDSRWGCFQILSVWRRSGKRIASLGLPRSCVRKAVHLDWNYAVLSSDFK